MKTLLLMLLLSTPALAQAQEPQEELPLCAMAVGYKKYRPIARMNKIDKFKHCALSCQIALKCSARQTEQLGKLKEIWDAMGNGTPDENDLKANMIGIKFAKSGQAKNDTECLGVCDNVDWRDLL
jgi:hypothetical protein